MYLARTIKRKLETKKTTKEDCFYLPCCAYSKIICNKFWSCYCRDSKSTWCTLTEDSLLDHKLWALIMLSFSCTVYHFVENNLMKNHLRYKKTRPSKVELYLEVNAWTDWQQQDLISQGLAYWTHKYYTGSIIAS